MSNQKIVPGNAAPVVMLTIAKFAVRYGVCRTRVYEILNKGEIAAVKAGRSTLIPLAEAEAWAKRLPKYEPGAVVAQAAKASKP